MQYKIVYSDRKSIAIKVSDGEVYVLVPNSARNSALYNKKIADFVREKYNWIKKNIKKQQEEKLSLPKIFDYEKFYVYDRPVIPIFSDKISNIRITESEIIISRSLLASRETFERELKKAYKAFAKKELKVRLEELSQKTGLSYTALRVSDAGTRWGSCNSNKCISLNWRITILQHEIGDYIIIHELCHTVQLNHSAAFWSAVRKFCPNFVSLKIKLKSFGFLTSFLKNA